MRTGLSARLGRELGLALIACAVPVHASAELAATPYFRTLGAADGLPSSAVRALAEDRDGFIWIGTLDGLARYDGVGFRVFRHNPADAQSIAGNDVSALFIDRDNRLWCGGEDAGLNLLDTRRGGFAHFRHDPSDPRSLATNDVWAIAQSTDGAIWAGGYGGGVDRLDETGGGFHHFRHTEGVPDGLASDNVIALLGDSHGRVWIGTDVGIDVIDVDGAARHLDLPAAVAPGTPLNVIKLMEDADGSVLAATRIGVLRVDAALRATVLADSSLADKVVYSLMRDADGSLWIGTRGGLHRRSVDGRMDVYTENTTLPGSLPANAVFDSLRDHEGGLWFALRESGIIRLAPQWREFALFRHDPENRASLSANHAQGMDVDAAGRIWAVNSSAGIDRLDPVSGNVERWAERFPAPDKALWSVLDDRRGQLWVGHGRGLRVYEISTGRFSDLPVDPRRRDCLARGSLRQLMLDDDAGVVWALARGGGMHRIDVATRRIERFDEASGTLRNADINQFTRGPRGEVLLGGAAGVDWFDAAERRFMPLAGTPEQRVHALTFAGDGTLWLHVLGALEHYRLDHGSATLLQRIDAADGWPAQTVTGLATDARRALWVGSARGLWRVDPGTRALRVFDGRNDLASGEFSEVPFVRRDDGTILGATLAGIVGFDPRGLAEGASPPRLKLDAATVARDGHDLVLDADAPSVELNWNDRNLRFSARALSFVNPSANRYQWQLAGFDHGWIDTGSRGEREFSQLAPGEYRLRLRAANSGGVWSEPGAPMSITVAPPPWATRWAYAAYVLAVALATWLAVHAWRVRLDRRHRYALAQQQRRFAEQASAAKTEFLATMGHEIRTPMTGVLGMAELLLCSRLDGAQRRYAEAIQNSGRVLLRIVNDTLDLARIEAGRLDLEDVPFDLHKLLHDVESLEKPLADAKGLAWKLRIVAGVPRHVRGDAARVEQILLNLVSNAIKFSEQGVVSLDAARVSSGIEFAVSDSGPGVPEALRERLFQRFEQAQGPRRRSGSGLGLAICRELTARMGGTIKLDSRVGHGSTFRVKLPLPEAASIPEAPQTLAVSARSVLLVEDDATVAAVIAGLLEAMNQRVVHAAHGLAALAELETASFDAVLIDLDLPGVDGLTLARLLRAREGPGARRLRLVGITARSVGDEEALCLAAGMDAFLRKPVTAGMLADVLRRTEEPAPAHVL
jgi:signal transduction histidine kinase/CheY-like chemotaxis protein/streptogramin lyase